MSFLRLALKKVLCQWILLYALYFVFRLLFLFINRSQIADLDQIDWWLLLQGGFRFDSATLAYLTILWTVLTFVLPLHSPKKWQSWLLGLSFYVPHIIALLFEVSDWIYFNYIRKRSTFDVFDLIFSKGDFLNLLPNYILTFWYVPVFGALAIWFSVFTHERLNKYFTAQALLFKSLKFNECFKTMLLGRVISLVLIIGVLIVAMRGGFQLRPITISNAVSYVAPNQVALVLNTPFSIFGSAESGRLNAVDFMSPEEADALVKPIKQYHQHPDWNKKNVVFIVWESLSKRFTKLERSKTLLPFLDSLIDQSYVFDNAYANALRSNEGLPAIFSGFPAMMEGAIITSMYSNNTFSSFPKLLADQGYQTAFYHGGNNGTMSIDIYAKNAGFNQYFGRNEYGLKNDYDGTWGIWDKPFFDFALKGITQLKSPFLATVYSLTSHAPYNVPEGYSSSNAQKSNKVEQSFAYTDEALAQFFHEAEKTEWYNKTIFVITADHGSPETKQLFYLDGLGRYQIPIIVFEPGGSVRSDRNHRLVSQLDIGPTILDYLGYHLPFFSLGNSALQVESPQFFFSYLSGNFSFIKNGWHFKTNQNEIIEAFKYPEDQVDKKNFWPGVSPYTGVKEAIQYQKAFSQILYNGMIENKLHLNTYQSSHK